MSIGEVAMTIAESAMTIGGTTAEAAASGALGALAQGGLRVAALLLLLTGFVLVLRRASPATRHAVWRTGFVVALLLPLLGAALPWRLELLPGASEAARAGGFLSPVVQPEPDVVGAAEPYAAAYPMTADESAVAGEWSAGATWDPSPASQRQADASAATSGGGLALGPMLLAAWLLGAALLMLRLLVGHLVIGRILRSGRRLEDWAWTSPLYEAADILDVEVDVELVASDRVTMPFTARVRRPAIVVPDAAEGWDRERRRAVLMHELAHIRRRDLFSHHVARWVCALHWFNPLAWAGARRMRADSERAADDLVLNAGTRPSDYADHLLQIVSGAGRSLMPAPALPLAQRREFEGRVLAILEPAMRRRVPGRLQTMVVSALVLMMTLPLAALDRAGPAEAKNGAPEGASAAAVDAVDRDGDGDGSANRTTSTNSNSNGNTNDDDDDGEASRAAAADASGDAPAPPEPQLPPSFRVHIEAVQPAERKIDLVGELLDGAMGLAAEAAAPVVGAAIGAGLDAALPALMDALDDHDVDVRRSVVEALGDMDDPRAVQALVRILLEDAVDDVRAAAAWALGEIEDPAAVDALVQALRSDRSVEVRRRSAWALGQIEDARAVDGLGAALRDEDAEVRQTAMWALGEIESPAAVPALVGALSSEDPEVRETAAWALGEIESAQAVSALMPLVADATPAVRAAAVHALAQIEDPAAAPALAAALADESAEVRGRAAYALGDMDLETAPAALIAALRDSHPDVRMAAAHALGEICDPASIGALTAAMRDANEDVRRAAIHALVEMDSDEAMGAMIELLDHDDPDVRKHAAEALGRN